MNKKSLIAIVLCGIIAATLIFGAYQFGYNAGNTVGYNSGYAKGSAMVPISPGLSGTGYNIGYQDGFKAAQNTTSPTRGP